jgi:hypothetical protein
MVYHTKLLPSSLGSILLLYPDGLWNFVDEAGVSLTPIRGKTRAPKGIKPIEKKRVVAETFINFLDNVRLHHKGRKVIIEKHKKTEACSLFNVEYTETEARATA